MEKNNFRRGWIDDHDDDDDCDDDGRCMYHDRCLYAGIVVYMYEGMKIW